MVYQAKDCRVRGDRQRQRNHGNDGETWRFKHRPERISEVRYHYSLFNSLGEIVIRREVQ
jgi:hypothetical protein